MDIFTRKLSDGIAITLRKPSNNNEKKPVIILCHGFCGIQEILVPSFAEAFTLAGFATVTFDFRGFGDSEGERGRLVPSKQIEDILSVIKWVKEQPELDARRIGLWGTSLGGCHVFGAAAREPEIKCIVSQLGFSDGEKVVTGKMSEPDKESFLATLNKIAEKQNNTGKEMFVSITRVLNDEESKSFFDKNKTLYPKMDVKIPFLTIREILQYKPANYASKVICPALVVIAEKDTVNPPEQGRALFFAASSVKKQLYVEIGARHYDIYSGEHFSNVVDVQLAWFMSHL